MGQRLIQPPCFGLAQTQTNLPCLHPRSVAVAAKQQERAYASADHDESHYLLTVAAKGTVPYYQLGCCYCLQHDSCCCYVPSQHQIPAPAALRPILSQFSCSTLKSSCTQQCCSKLSTSYKACMPYKAHIAAGPRDAAKVQHSKPALNLLAHANLVTRTPSVEVV